MQPTRLRGSLVIRSGSQRHSAVCTCSLRQPNDWTQALPFRWCHYKGESIVLSITFKSHWHFQWNVYVLNFIRPGSLCNCVSYCSKSIRYSSKTFIQMKKRERARESLADVMSPLLMQKWPNTLFVHAELFVGTCRGWIWDTTTESFNSFESFWDWLWCIWNFN